MMQLRHPSRGPDASHDHAGYARRLAVAAAVIAGLSWAPRPAAAEDRPAAFISALGEQAPGVIHRPGLPLAGKAAYFQQLIRQNCDMSGILRFVLGPYWRVANPGERQEFSALLTQRLIHLYGRRLAQDGYGVFVASGSRTGPDGGDPQLVIFEKAPDRRGPDHTVVMR